MTVNVVVIGAGVSGLTTALQLAKHRELSVTIVAKHMPGDTDIEYSSPWAGANYMPFSHDGTPARQYERKTWAKLKELATTVPEAGIHFQDTHAYRRTKDSGTPVGEWMAPLMLDEPWFKDMLPNFRHLSETDLPGDVDTGTAFTSVCINPALYLPWLASQCLRLGVQIRRGDLHSILDATSQHASGNRAEVVVNCTGLGARVLGGVQDGSVYPGRGQIAIVRNEAGGRMTAVSGTDDAADEAVYIMQRPAGGGTVLGGCLQADCWESQPDPNLAQRILQRCVRYCPALCPGGGGVESLSIVRHAVGLRPMRRDGIRVELEVCAAPDAAPAVTVVHNYGHGGYGYQTSYGCAEAVEALVLDHRTTLGKL